MKFHSMAVGLIILLWAGDLMQAQPWPPTYQQPVNRMIETGAPNDLPWTLEQLLLYSGNLKKARMNDKYQMLMLQFDAPKSAEKYGALHDLGWSTGPAEVQMPPDLPQLPLPGYWVYAEPSWYVWHQLAIKNIPKRAAGAEQVVGLPNTTFMGKQSNTAWSSKSPDEPNEWLLVEFENTLQPCRLQIYQSLHPGAIKRITMMALDGSEVEVWSGFDPTRTLTNGAGMFELKLNYPPHYSFIDPNPVPRAMFSTNRVKLYLDSAAVQGWNEIDAVALMDFSNIPRWASAAVASTSRGDQGQLNVAALPGALIGGWKPEQSRSIPTIDLSDFDILRNQIQE